MPVTPPAPLHTLEDDGECLKIVIPTPKQWFAIFFLPLWLIGWAFGLFFASSSLLKAFNPFVMLWLSFWLFGGGSAIVSLLWMLGGKEIVEISRQALILRRQIFGLRWPWPREYLADDIKDLRVVPLAAPNSWGVRRSSPWSFDDGPLAFDYGAKTFRFGQSIDEAEGKQILAAIQQRFPQYRRSLD